MKGALIYIVLAGFLLVIGAVVAVEAVLRVKRRRRRRKPRSKIFDKLL